MWRAISTVAAGVSLALAAAPAEAGSGVLWLSRPVFPGRAYDGTVDGRPMVSVRVGETVVVRGRAFGVSRRARVVLQGETAGRVTESTPWDTTRRVRWRPLASGRVHGTDVLARLHVPAQLGSRIRLAAIDGGRLLSAGKPLDLEIGPAPVLCIAPAVPPLPSGEGAVVGGVVGVGGPAPGGSFCGAGAGVAVELVDAAGTTVATETVAGRASYVFVVAPGAYSLNAGGCTGQVTVSAGHVTRADAICPVP